jgi:hypothetical protein
MTMMDERIRWAPKVGRAKINRLYQTDARGIVDEALIDDVGTALLARCESVLTASRAQARCPRCATVFTIGWGPHANPTMICPAGCGWQTTVDAWHRSWQHQDLIGVHAAEAFEHYVALYPLAQTAQQKMLLIDGLIHAFHQGIIEGSPHRSAANNLIEGSYRDVLAFLDALTYGAESTPGLRERDAGWRVQAAMAKQARRGHK